VIGVWAGVGQGRRGGGEEEGGKGGVGVEEKGHSVKCDLGSPALARVFEILH
jgi:hypothetical protein